MTDTTALPHRLLEVVENDILPLNARGIALGNKPFGAAILRKSDLSLVIAEGHNGAESPLWHGEMYALKRFYELPSCPAVGDLIFLTTHEPCTMCMSAITWAGFDNFFYVLGHEDMDDPLSPPLGPRIMKEVFGLAPDGYRHRNAFWVATALADLIAAAGPGERQSLETRRTEIKARYAELATAFSVASGNSDSKRL